MIVFKIIKFIIILIIKKKQSDRMNGHVGIEIRGKTENLGIASKFIGNTMAKFGLNDYTQFQVQISVEEALKNIMEHGNLEEDKIKIKCQKNGEIKIFIQYPGKSFDPAAFKKTSLKTDSSNDRKEELKVYFIRKYMNNIKHEFENGMNILILTKRV